jgi:hypothetical protein
MMLVIVGDFTVVCLSYDAYVYYTAEGGASGVGVGDQSI